MSLQMFLKLCLSYDKRFHIDLDCAVAKIGGLLVGHFQLTKITKEWFSFQRPICQCSCTCKESAAQTLQCYSTSKFRRL